MGIDGIEAQKSLEVSLDVGINIPRTIQNNVSNSPYKYGYNGSLEIAYHLKWIGVALQSSYFNINDQEYTIINNFQTHTTTASATNFRGEKSRAISVYLPLYIHVYNKNKFRVSPLIGLGLVRFRKSAFTWKIDQFSTIKESDVKLENSNLLALKIGFNITHKLGKQIALKYGAQRGYLSEVFGDTFVLYDFNVGVTYSIFDKM